ncbi:hypothetical protein ACFVR1_14710 [Psychrobacillus sp. NPDC058041]|uniref:hypothetical protein n=1 Tax=Psychrobacillus sp. NPDC058041 TaxID=3346310 RepID=UPI0036DB7F9B
MLFFEGEIKKVSKKVGTSGLSTMRLQDPRLNGQLRKDQIAKEIEARNAENRRNQLLNGYK